MLEPRNDVLARAEGSRVLPPGKAVFWTYILTFCGAAAWFAGIFLAPYLRSRSSPWQALIYAVYTPVCHQVASRCFHFLGHPLAVCARCSGIYLGFLAGLGLYALRRGFHRVQLPSTRAFLAISAPIVLDTLGNFLRLWSTGNTVRFATGVLWGAILPFYFITGVAEFVLAGKGSISFSVIRVKGQERVARRRGSPGGRGEGVG
jgi:uncharacterized membrane protein